jgi:hypothetical protein
MTTILIIIVLIINAVVAHIIGNVAKDRKIGYNTAFLLSFLLSPLLGIRIVIASPLVVPGDVKKINKKTQPDEKEYKEGLSKEDLIVITIRPKNPDPCQILLHLRRRAHVRTR